MPAPRVAPHTGSAGAGDPGLQEVQDAPACPDTQVPSCKRPGAAEACADARSGGWGPTAAPGDGSLYSLRVQFSGPGHPPPPGHSTVDTRIPSHRPCFSLPRFTGVPCGAGAELPVAASALRLPLLRTHLSVPPRRSCAALRLYPTTCIPCAPSFLAFVHRGPRQIRRSCSSELRRGNAHPAGFFAPCSLPTPYTVFSKTLGHTGSWTTSSILRLLPNSCLRVRFCPAAGSRGTRLARSVVVNVPVCNEES